MQDTLIIIFAAFIVGLATGLIVSRFVTEKKERDLLSKLEEIGKRNNEIFDDFKQCISFNNKLAERNRDLSDRLDIFVKEWNGE